MGRYLRIIFVALLFIMVGCGEDDTESTTVAESKTSENSVVVGAEGISPNVLNSSEDGLDIVFSGGGAKWWKEGQTDWKEQAARARYQVCRTFCGSVFFCHCLEPRLRGETSSLDHAKTVEH